MRIALVVLLAGCTSAHPINADRTDCVTCHPQPALADPSPPPACTLTDHASYPTTCSTCHGTTAWCPADAMHTKFSLIRPSHAGWDCADCHQAITYAPPAVTDPKAIACTNCHWHDQARVDPFHVGKSGYTYGPATCLAPQCHGGGGE